MSLAFLLARVECIGGRVARVEVRGGEGELCQAPPPVDAPLLCRPVPHKLCQLRRRKKRDTADFASYWLKEVSSAIRK